MTHVEQLASALRDRYSIERELGAGGMATVYLAADLKHDRKVAIKVLKPELAAVLGAERFVVEIKTTAALQHPHILPLFDSGTAGGFLFYVMPYIQGETVREKLNRENQFGVDEAIRIAREVADALDYAHRHGVIHRDIKPENILLHDGRPMVMDFGIALAVSAAAGGRMTETGLSLGTPHYMSPEQATAEKEITPRSDVYSLASVLYEMLAGQPPHVGGAAQQVIMKIITETAQPVTALRKSVPPNVAYALAKALEKLPADRLDSARAFADALANASFATTGVGAMSVAGVARAGVSVPVFAATAAVAVAAMGALVWLTTRPTAAPESPVVRVPVDMPNDERLWLATTSTIAISPQGDRLAYLVQGSAGVRMSVRRTDPLDGHDVLRTVGNQPAFSPDGRWIAYTDGTSIFKLPSDGGASISLATRTALVVRGLSWITPDTILVGADDGIFWVPAAGGRLNRLPGVDSTRGGLSPVLLSDGRTVAFVSGLQAATRRLAITSLTSHATTVFNGVVATSVLGMRDGRVVYATTAGELFAVPVDLKRQKLTGDPVQVERGIRISSTGQALASLSTNGSLLYVGGQQLGHLVRVAPNGTATAIFDEQRAFRGPRFSPDGRLIAVEVSGPGGSDIWVYDLQSRTFVPVTTEPGSANATAEWSHDSKRVLFRSMRGGQPGVWWQAVDRTGVAELLFQPDHPINEVLMSPDGKWLVYRTAPGDQMRDIYAVPLDGERKKTLLVGGPSQESHARVSPNGAWLAYQSNESGRFEVFVRPFPEDGPRVPVSNQGGAEPVWARSGNTIYYRTLTGGLEAASVTSGATFTVGQRREVFPPLDYLNDVSHTGFDVWPDGSAFLMVRPVSGEVRPVLVHNWGRELREKLSSGKPN